MRLKSPAVAGARGQGSRQALCLFHLRHEGRGRTALQLAPGGTDLEQISILTDETLIRCADKSVGAGFRELAVIPFVFEGDVGELVAGPSPKLCVQDEPWSTNRDPRRVVVRLRVKVEKLVNTVRVRGDGQ
jgi:hypothetical protein